jgi:pimeloyl-ACP methyl ester carboxylesterase
MTRSPGLVLLGAAACGLLLSAAPPADFEPITSIWARCRETLPPVSFEVLSDAVVASDTDPALSLRRVEVRFTSQTVGQWERRMAHTAVIHMPADPARNASAARRGKVVIIASAYGDTTIVDNYGEPIAALTGYPTMVLPVPGEYDGHDGESCWVYFFRALLQDTQDPMNHQYFRLAVPYLRALDVFQAFLKADRLRAVIGGHSKRAPSAFNAAALDPERVAGVVYMGMESTFAGYEGKPWQGISPAHSQATVSCPVLYLGATNEDGYEMFNINRLQARMTNPWTIDYIPNYRHSTNSEIQILNWRMWVSHVFDGRPVARVDGPEWEENAEGTIFRAAIDTPNKLIYAKAWYVYCDDVPYWRDLMWYPAYMKRKGDKYEAFVSGKLPDAWLVEVKDIASGRVGYVTSLPQDITGKPTKERYSRGWKSRNWEPKKAPAGPVRKAGDGKAVRP